jgi:quinolinate synthase
MENKKLIEKINKLKKQKNAVILVHNYQRPEIYEIADFIGDSLELAKKATGLKQETIIFCGVKFMAETAKILNPDKTVLLPDRTAGCPMADMITLEQLKQFKKENPKAKVVTYVNSNAEVKTESDVCCTSANAVDIVKNLDAKKILFVPDKHLGDYVKKQTKKNIISWKGFCPIHDKITEKEAKKAKQNHPYALLIAHPECPKNVLKHADYIFSTGGMVKFVRKNSNKELIIATETNMINRLKKENPNNKYYTIGKTCSNMRKITLQSVLNALEKNKYPVTVPEEMRIKAKKAIDRMIKNVQ